MRRLTAVLAGYIVMCVTSIGNAMPGTSNISIIAPQPSEIAATYPNAAKGKNVKGFVLLICTVGKANSANCVSGQWNPGGYGFESAAIQIAAKLKIEPNGEQSTEGTRFDLPVNFPASSLDSITPIPTLGAIQPYSNIPLKPHVINPITIIPPTPDNVSAVFPDAARGANVAGQVLLACTVQDGGTLGCRIVSETPSGYNFGAAAVELSKKFRAKSNDQFSHVGYQINIPIRFPPNSMTDSAPQ